MREKLQRAILALAQPAGIRLSLFPDFVCKADELAMRTKSPHRSEPPLTRWTGLFRR